ncbi:MAG: hypothetical protein H0V92_05680, partial [Pseudonocardiales bacterium]|nr:hypothetical protein [Pseudonocardiales bacterium]
QRVFQLYCSSYSATSTLFPLRAGLERYADMNSDDTDVERLDKLEAACADLGIDSAGILPALGTLLDVDLAGRYPPLDLSPAQLQRVLLERMTALLPNITEGPAILVLEDLQWADPTTLELLDRLAAVGLPRGLLILGTARPGLRWTPSNDSAATIRLGALSDAEAQEVALAAGAGGLSEADAQEIVARADGVPLFVEQLTHAFGEIGLSTLSNESVPQTLIQLLQARLDAVGSAKLVAQVAATIGREFHVELVETVMAKLAGGGAPDACAVPVEHHLKQLADADLIEPMKYDGLLRFRHALMRDAAYQAQLMRDRRARHGVVADILAEAKTGDAALTAFHFEHAERPLDALSHYLQAVSRAQTAGAFTEVLAHLDRCEDLLGEVADENLRARFELAVRLNHGLVVSSTAGYAAPGAVADYNRARELCSTLGEVPGVAEELLKVLFAIWNYYCSSGDFDTTETICSAIEHQLGRATIRSGRHVLDACRGIEAFYRGNLQLAEELLSPAVAGMARDGIDPSEWWQPHEVMAAACVFLGPLRFLMGDEAGALQAIRTGLARSQPLEFPKGPFSVAFVRTSEASLHRRRHDVPAALAAAEEICRIGERHGFSDWQIVGQIHLSAAKAMSNTSSAALDEMGVALESWRAVGGETLIPWLVVEQASGYLILDDVENAGACLGRALEGMRRGQQLGLPEALAIRAELRLRTDPAATVAAEGDLREAIDVARTQGDVYALLRAALAHRRLLDSEGDELVDTALADAVEAYRDASAFPGLAQARALVAASGRVRLD